MAFCQKEMDLKRTSQVEGTDIAKAQRVREKGMHAGNGQWPHLAVIFHSLPDPGEACFWGLKMSFQK